MSLLCILSFICIFYFLFILSFISASFPCICLFSLYLPLFPYLHSFPISAIFLCLHPCPMYVSFPSLHLFLYPHPFLYLHPFLSLPPFLCVSAAFLISSRFAISASFPKNFSFTIYLQPFQRLEKELSFLFPA